MTTTPTVQVSNQWQVFADTSFGDAAVTIQNYEINRLCIFIDDTNDPTLDDRGLYIPGEEKELYAGFEGKLWLRYPLLEDGKTKSVGVMKS